MFIYDAFCSSGQIINVLSEMSGFSAELIDYLEGRITFEEFDKRRDERKAKVSL